MFRCQAKTICLCYSYKVCYYPLARDQIPTHPRSHLIARAISCVNEFSTFVANPRFLAIPDLAALVRVRSTSPLIIRPTGADGHLLTRGQRSEMDTTDIPGGLSLFDLINQPSAQRSATRRSVAQGLVFLFPIRHLGYDGSTEPDRLCGG